MKSKTPFLKILKSIFIDVESKQEIARLKRMDKIKKSIHVYKDKIPNDFILWDELKRNLELYCFNSDDIGYTYLHEILPAFFTVEEKYVSSIPLNIIDSISTSKSDNKRYKDIFEFGEDTYTREKWSFNESIDYVLRRYNNHYLEFDWYTWNNRYHWINFDASHHFSCAYYLNKIQNRNYIIQATNQLKIKINKISLNFKAINEFFENYEIFITYEPNFINFHSIYDYHEREKLEIKDSDFREESFYSFKLYIISKKTTDLIEVLSENKYFLNYKYILQTNLKAKELIY